MEFTTLTEPTWRAVLLDQWSQPYMRALSAFLQQEIVANKVVYPASEYWFAALNATPLQSVRVVILGQDPYHGEGQAHGLSFSVPNGMALPPSLRNIYKELNSDLGITPAVSGDLHRWAAQGVLLLNSVLTVEQGQAASHQGQGWERLTDRIIEVINEQCTDVVFVLWGNYAKNKGRLIDRNKHGVIAGVHPSPLSAHRGFFGSRPFSAVNDWLAARGRTVIEW